LNLLSWFTSNFKRHKKWNKQPNLKILQNRLRLNIFKVRLPNLNRYYCHGTPHVRDCNLFYVHPKLHKKPTIQNWHYKPQNGHKG
jgi:hypothetical protein